MDWYIIIAGLIAAATTVGHFVVGSKKFLKPMLEVSFDPIPKKVMHCVFHYVSTYLILSTLALLLIGLGIWSGNGTAAVINFIAVNYVLFGIWQIVLAITSDIPNAIFKLFQWIFFALIAIFSFLGAGYDL
jgi:hypothetical protein